MNVVFLAIVILLYIVGTQALFREEQAIIDRRNSVVIVEGTILTVDDDSVIVQYRVSSNDIRKKFNKSFDDITIGDKVLVSWTKDKPERVIISRSALHV